MLHPTPLNECPSPTGICVRAFARQIVVQQILSFADFDCTTAALWKSHEKKKHNTHFSIRLDLIRFIHSCTKVPIKNWQVRILCKWSKMSDFRFIYLFYLWRRTYLKWPVPRSIRVFQALAATHPLSNVKTTVYAAEWPPIRRVDTMLCAVAGISADMALAFGFFPSDWRTVLSHRPIASIRPVRWTPLQCVRLFLVQLNGGERENWKLFNWFLAFSSADANDCFAWKYPKR